MVNKILTRLKEILNTNINSQDLIVIILLGGFAFLIQATITPDQYLVFAYLIYVIIAFLSFEFSNWNQREHKK